MTTSGQEGMDIGQFTDIWSNATEILSVFDVSGVDYPGQIKSLPTWEISLKILLYASIIIASVIGNTLVILVVIRNKRLQTTTNYYIVNLAISDMLITIFCSWVHLVDDLTEGWVLGAFLCKFDSFAQGMFIFLNNQFQK